MIYLIGGAPKCGKTTLAKHLSSSTGIAWIATDNLQDAVKPYVSEEEFERKFPASLMKYDNNDEKFVENSTSQIIAAYRVQAKTMSRAIEAFVKSAILDGKDDIIEGYHIEPELISRLTIEFPKEVKGVLLIKTDAEAFLENIKKSTTPNDWIKSRTKHPKTFEKIAKMVTEYSSQLKNKANKSHIKVFHTDQNFDIQFNKIEAYLLSPK